MKTLFFLTYAVSIYVAWKYSHNRSSSDLSGASFFMTLISEMFLFLGFKGPLDHLMDVHPGLGVISIILLCMAPWSIILLYHPHTKTVR